MTSSNPPPDRRHSIAQDASVIEDTDELARAEARNGLRQFDVGMRLVEDALAKGTSFKLRPSHLLTLHREALLGISAAAGVFRPAGVAIGGSRHEPPGAHLVPELIEEMCDYVNERWSSATPVHLASYVIWRLNWIHPFKDGNGRTSRVASYVVLCVAAGYILPGTNTIPDQIVANRKLYFTALEAAGAAYGNGSIDVTAMEELLERLLAVQLTGVFDKATGRTSLSS